MRKFLFLSMALLSGLLIFGSTALASEDVGVSAVLSPPEKVVIDYQYHLNSVIFNLGTEASTFKVYIEIAEYGSSSNLLKDSVTVTGLPSGAIDTVSFTQTFTPVADTSFQILSYTILGTDEEHANDSAAVICSTFYGVAVWYGNLDMTPIAVDVNHRVSIETYVQTSDNVLCGDAHLCLGFNLAYIDSLLNTAEGQVYYPFTEWDAAYFANPDYGPPVMPEGFASQSFQGYAELTQPYDSPLLSLLTPTRVVTYVVKTANDSSLIGGTLNALVTGYNQFQGASNASDSAGNISFDILEHHAPFYFRGAGTVTGQVTNENSIPLNGVEVIDLNSMKTTYTNPSGSYTLPNLYPGLHNISFSHPDQRDTVVTDVNIPRNGTKTLNVQMQALPTHDVGVSKIISPPIFVQQNITYPLKSEIRNYGSASSSFDVVIAAYALNSTTPLVTGTKTITDLPAGMVDTVAFDETLFTSLDTTYQLISYTLLVDDIDATNDTATSTSSIFFGVSAWYGNLDGSPMPAFIGEKLGIDVYIQTLEDIYLSYIHLCLGAADQYVDSLLSKNEGTLYYPFTEWDIAQFMTPQGTPSNPEGWTSQSFVGFSSIGASHNPWLHYEVPTKSLTFETRIVEDLLLVGNTIQCFGAGQHPTFGPSNASDTLALNSYPIIEVFSPVYFKAVGFVSGYVTNIMEEPIQDVYITAIGLGVADSTDINGEYALDSLTIGYYDILFSHPLYRDTIVSNVEVRLRETTIIDMVMIYPCDFMPGDVNGNGFIIGSDVTYLVMYLAGKNPPPPDSCFNSNSGEWLYSAADANGDCLVIGSDVTYLVNYLRYGVQPLYCPYTPPPGLLIYGKDIIKIPMTEDQETISFDAEDKR